MNVCIRIIRSRSKAEHKFNFRIVCCIDSWRMEEKERKMKEIIDERERDRD